MRAPSAGDEAAADLALALASHPRNEADDLPAVRAAWWRLRRAGIALPPDADTIVIRGGRR